MLHNSPNTDFAQYYSMCELKLSAKVFYNLPCHTYSITSTSQWLPNVMIINSWPHCMKGGKELQEVGIKEGAERVADVTRIIT